LSPTAEAAGAADNTGQTISCEFSVWWVVLVSSKEGNHGGDVGMIIVNVANKGYSSVMEV
jgi:hypothetical protein